MEKNSGDQGRRDADTRPATNSNQQKETPAELSVASKWLRAFRKRFPKKRTVLITTFLIAVISGIGHKVGEAVAQWMLNKAKTILQSEEPQGQAPQTGASRVQDGQVSQPDSLEKKMASPEEASRSSVDAPPKHGARPKVASRNLPNAPLHAPERSSSRGESNSLATRIEFEISAEKSEELSPAPQENDDGNTAGLRGHALARAPQIKAQRPYNDFEKDLSALRTPERVQKNLRKHSLVIQGLYQNMLKQSPHRRGAVVVSFALDSKGRLTNAKIVASNLFWPEFEQQLLKRMSAWNDFGESERNRGPLTYRVTYVFSD